MVALSLLNCEGRELLVEELKPEEEIQIGIAHELDMVGACAICSFVYHISFVNKSTFKNEKIYALLA